MGYAGILSPIWTGLALTGLQGKVEDKIFTALLCDLTHHEITGCGLWKTFCRTILNSKLVLAHQVMRLNANADTRQASEVEQTKSLFENSSRSDEMVAWRAGGWG